MRNVFVFMISLLVVAAQAQIKPKSPAQTQPQSATEQVTPTRPVNPFVEHFAKKNALANRWNDFEQAKDALYDLIVETGNDSLVYVLAMYYYENRQYISSVLVTQDLLTSRPKDIDLLQLAASNYEALGLKDKALASYESVYLQNSNTALLYKMAIMQYDLKKYPEAKTNTEILLTKHEVDSMKVTIAGTENKQKEYPLKAALLNLKGLLLLQENNKPDAKKAFDEAIALSPEFPLAKQNLAKLK